MTRVYQCIVRNKWEFLSVALVLSVLTGYIISIFNFDLTVEQEIRYYLRSGLFLDDAFYYYKTAFNFIKYGLPSFDLINTTNGFHPLWFIFVSPFTLLDPVYLLRSVVLIENVFYFGSVLIISACFGSFGWKRFAVLLFVLSLATWNLLYRNVINGLETSIHLFVMSYSVFLLHKCFDEVGFLSKKSRTWLLAVVFLILIFSRLESALFVLVAIFFMWSRRIIPFDRLKAICFFLAVALSIYLLTNYLYVGEFFPVSGSAKQIYASFLHKSLVALTSEWKVWLDYVIWPIRYPWLLIVITINFVSVFFYLRYNNVSGLIFAVYCSVKYFMYVLLYKDAAGGYLWYYAPDSLCFLYFIFWVGIRFFSKRLVVAFAVVAPYVFYQQYTINSGNFYHHYFLVKNDFAPRVGNELDTFYLSSQLLNKVNLPGDFIIGMHNCGVFGYFSRYRVINMDGLINGSVRLGFIKKYNQDWLPYIDNAQYIDSYVDTIPVSSLLLLTQKMASRGFSLHALQTDLDRTYGQSFDVLGASQMVFYYRSSSNSLK